MAKGSVLATVSSCLWNNPSWQVRQFAIALQPRKHSVHWDVWNKCSIEAIFVFFCQKYIRFCRIAFAAYTAANANFLIFPPHLFCFCNCQIEEKFNWSNFDETYCSTFALKLSRLRVSGLMNVGTSMLTASNLTLEPEEDGSPCGSFV